MGKTRAECSQNAYTSHASAFLCHWIQILANYSPKSDIKKKPTLFFRILRSVGRGQHNKKKIGLMTVTIDQFGFKNIISLHPPYLGGFQEHDKRWVFQTMYCFSSGTGVCLGHCIIFCLSWKPPRYGGRHALETELVYNNECLVPVSSQSSLKRGPVPMKFLSIQTAVKSSRIWMW